MPNTLTISIVSILLTLFLSACTIPVQVEHDDMPGMEQQDMPDDMSEDISPMDQMDQMDADNDMPDMDHGDMMSSADPDQFDARFIDGMIEHHQGAVDMAEQVLEETERPELRTLAEAIIAAQVHEIEQMEEWRAAWFPDLEPTAGMDMDMGAMEISPDEDRPFDQRFIEAMISHHEGAIDMAETALQMSQREEIRVLAAVIIADQQAEIDQMRAWLQEWYEIEE